MLSLAPVTWSAALVRHREHSHSLPIEFVEDRVREMAKDVAPKTIIVPGPHVRGCPQVSISALTVIATDDELLQFTQETINHLKSESQVVTTLGGHRLEVLPPAVLEAITSFIDREPPANRDVTLISSSIY